MATRAAIFAGLGLLARAAHPQPAPAAAARSSAAAPPLGPLQTVSPLVNLGLSLRHCSFICSVCPSEVGNQDFSFVLVAPLNGAADGASFSLQSAGYPDHYLAIANSSSGAVGIEGPSPDADDATWTFAPGLAPAPPNTTDAFTLVSQSKNPSWAGKLLTATTTHTSPCVYADPAGDVMLTDGSTFGAARSTWIVGRMPPVPPAPTSYISVDASTVTNAAVSPKTMGCHHDYGFAQAPRGFFSELVYGTSFDAGTQAVPAWHSFFINSSAAAPLMTAYTSFSARPTLGLSLDHDFATVGMANRGIGNAGLYLEAGKPYNVEFWAWCGAGAGNEPTVYVELVDFTNGNASLARADVKLISTGPPWGTDWFHFNVTLTPSAGTQCVGIPFDSDPSIDCGGNAGPAHVCVRCGGEFRIALTGPQSYGGINLAYASLKPGAWGLVTAKDGSSIDVLKSAGDVLTAMGVTLMRNGGSVSQSMRWKDWRGPRWNRPSAQQVWGYSLLSGWGPFEFADLGAALDIEPVITLAYDSNDADDFADLVEYCFGDAAATAWGRRRAADGHPAVYDIRVFELGNEQVNPFFVDQVVAMEARAKAVGAPPLYYMYPQNGGPDAQQAQRLLDAGVDPARILPDLHVGAGGAVDEAAGLFSRPPVPGFNQGAINAETNAGSHDLQRALDEAADLIAWWTADTKVTSRMYARTASFCSGSSNNFDQWDQGISFFLPNMTWFQPPGYVHVMVKATWAETVLASSFAPGNSTLPFAAMRTQDGKSLVLRAVNRLKGAQPISVALGGGASAAGPSYTLWLLGDGDRFLETDDNPPGDPERISPQSSSVPIAAGATTLSATLPPLSFAIMVVPLA